MKYDDKMSVVKKIIEIRDKYASKYLEPGVIRSGREFDLIHNKVVAELKQYHEDTTIAIDAQVIFASKENFDKYIETGVISEFIHIPGII